MWLDQNGMVKTGIYALESYSCCYHSVRMIFLHSCWQESVVSVRVVVVLKEAV